MREEQAGGGVMQHFYRIEAEWEGGGFGYTLPFDSSEQAAQWGMQRARMHPGAQVAVTDRGIDSRPPVSEAELDRLFGIDRRDLERAVQRRAEARGNR